MKNKRFGKKHLILCAMVLLLGGAVYLNYYIAANAPLAASSVTQQEEETSEPSRVLGQSQYVDTPSVGDAADYFEAARQSRADARQEAIDILQETLRDVKADDAEKQAATQTAVAVAKAVEQEDAVESLLKAKGFADCVVYIENGNCHVAVKGKELDTAQTLQITQIVTAQTDVTAERLSIVTVE